VTLQAAAAANARSSNSSVTLLKGGYRLDLGKFAMRTFGAGKTRHHIGGAVRKARRAPPPSLSEPLSLNPNPKHEEMPSPEPPSLNPKP
jgi:hypothetical protein